MFLSCFHDNDVLPTLIHCKYVFSVDVEKWTYNFIKARPILHFYCIGLWFLYLETGLIGTFFAFHYIVWSGWISEKPNIYYFIPLGNFIEVNYCQYIRGKLFKGNDNGVPFCLYINKGSTLFNVIIGWGSFMSPAQIRVRS